MMCPRLRAVIALAMTSLSVASAPIAAADNTHLNNGVAASVYTVRYRAGCALPDIRMIGSLSSAAQSYARDLVGHPELDGQIGSDGSTPQSRSAAAGYTGLVSQTVAINASLAINTLDVITQWYHDPAALRIMSDCANTAIGVWSENSLDRSVVVAVYGRPA
jgi:uncharacterized protein YkwD